jgi:TolB protein
MSVVDLGSGAVTPLVTPPGASGFDFTSDGSVLAYIALDGSGHHQVFVMDADGSNRRQLTHGTLGAEVTETPAQWSPDDSRLAYWVATAEGIEIFVVGVRGGASHRVTREPRDVFDGGWASDRSFVFSTSNPRSRYPLVARSIDLWTGKTATIARDVSNPDVSPDGTRVAFDSYDRPAGETWLSIMRIDGMGRRKIQRVSNTGSYPKWSPDGTKIALVDHTIDGSFRTHVYDLMTGETRFVTDGRIESWIDDNHILVS